MESSSLMQQQQLDLSNDHLPTYSKLTQLILNKYDLSVGENSTNSHEKLYNAILGMELAEHDGKPVPIHGHPYLFVGSAGALLRVSNKRGYHKILSYAHIFDETHAFHHCMYHFNRTHI